MGDKSAESVCLSVCTAEAEPDRQMEANKCITSLLRDAVQSISKSRTCYLLPWGHEFQLLNECLNLLFLTTSKYKYIQIHSSEKIWTIVWKYVKLINKNNYHNWIYLEMPWIIHSHAPNFFYYHSITKRCLTFHVSWWGLWCVSVHAASPSHTTSVKA